jgi:hypothetical protein
MKRKFTYISLSLTLFLLGSKYIVSALASNSIIPKGLVVTVNKSHKFKLTFFQTDEEKFYDLNLVEIENNIKNAKSSFNFSESDKKNFEYSEYMRFNEINSKYVDNCAANKVVNKNILITTKHCIEDENFDAYLDSSINYHSKEDLTLPKPRIGLGYILTNQFNIRDKKLVYVIKVNQCSAIFTVLKSEIGVQQYIQQGDSGGGLIQYDFNKKPILTGTLSSIFNQNKSDVFIELEDTRKASKYGIVVYRNCAKNQQF